MYPFETENEFSINPNKKMDQRETIEFKAGDNTFVIKSWLTAREDRAINSVIFDKVKFNPSMKESDMREGKGMAMEFNEIPANLTFLQQIEKIKQYVISLNGDDKNVSERCLDLRAGVFEELLEKVEGLHSGVQA